MARGTLLQRCLPRPPAPGVDVSPARSAPTLGATLLLAFVAGLIAATVRLSTVLTGYDSLSVASACLATAIIATLPWRVLRVVLAGSPRLARGSALRLALIGVALASGIVGTALYAGYRWLRPGYLTEHYDQYLAAFVAAGHAGEGGLREFTARRSWFEDPLAQALNSSLLLALAGTVTALFLVYRRPPRRQE